MAFNEIKYTQSVWHYQETNRKFEQNGGKRILTLYLQGPDACCRKCKSLNVRAYRHRNRELWGMPYGRCPVKFIVPVRKVVCRECGATTYENIPFAAYPNARITRALARAILEQAADMSMRAIAMKLDLSWRTVRDAIEDGLRKRYRRIDVSHATHLGIDELYVFRSEKSDRKYITVVRDTDTGKVLEVARGKGAKALEKFGRKLEPYKSNISAVSMDMSNAYASWVREALPGADIVLDHFHVIKALTDRLNKARRRVAAMVDEATAKQMKGCRHLLLKNREDLSPKEKLRFSRLSKMDVCGELMAVHLFKERMRSIYATASTEYDAAPLLDTWIADAAESAIPEMKSVAKTFKANREGILGYWRHDGMSNSATEGFNRKIRGLLMTAYGFHDYKFLRLRIFDLGEKKSIKE